MTSTAAAYAARAGEYADVLGSMGAVHPSDRELVETWARRVPGRVLDAGCGPGHWTAHLASLGIEVRGVDLVPAFIDRARRRFPGVRFDLGSIDDLDESDASYGGVLSWFSTIHHAPETIAVPLEEFRRVLRPGGLLALGFFTGRAVEPFDHAVTRAYRWPVAPLRALLDAAGFDVIEVHVREERGARPVGAIIAERRADGS